MPLHVSRESEVVELGIGAADDVNTRRRMSRQVSDLLFAMRGERTNRDQLRLDAGQDRVDHLIAVGGLEHDPIERPGTQPKKGDREAIRDLIELSVGYLALRSGKRQTAGIARERFAQGFGQRFEAENVVFDVTGQA